MPDRARPGLARVRRLLVRVLVYLLPAALFVATFWPLPRREGRDLFPFPDATEYALLASTMAQGQAPLLTLGHERFPSRYPLVVPAMFAPFSALAGNQLQRIWWCSALYGVLAVLMIVRVGTWLTGSRWAGALGAALWGLHLETITMAMHCMTETATVLLLMITFELARPWLTRRPRPAGPLRAALLGLFLGLCMLAKAPLVFLTIGLWSFVAWDALRATTRRWSLPLLAGVMMTLVFAANLAYQQWAFGDWRLNGYTYSAPFEYKNPGIIFNVKYLTAPFDAGWQVGNAGYFWNIFSGRRTEYFFGPVMPLVSAVCVLAALIAGLRRARSRRTVLLILSWSLFIFAFSLFYFWQSARFLLFCLMMLDFSVAWVLLRLLYSRRVSRLRLARGGWNAGAPDGFYVPGAAGARPLPSGLRLAPALRTLALLAVLGGLAWHVRADQRQYHVNFPFVTQDSYFDQIKPLLAQVPPDAWLLTGYQLALVQAWRPTPGPTAALYLNYPDCSMMNPHIGGIEHYKLIAHSPNPQWTASTPAGWRNHAALMIDAEGAWRLPPDELAAFIAQQPYVLILDPVELAIVRQYYEAKILPMLQAAAEIETVATNGRATLLRLHPHPTPNP